MAPGSDRGLRCWRVFAGAGRGFLFLWGAFDVAGGVPVGGFAGVVFEDIQDDPLERFFDREGLGQKIGFDLHFFFLIKSRAYVAL